MSPDDLLDSTIRIPDHVVYREFASETVVLNLGTGKYHGLNATGGRMLDALGRHGTGRAAAAELATAYGVPTDEVERDLVELCNDLLQRDLIEVCRPDE